MRGPGAGSSLRQAPLCEAAPAALTKPPPLHISSLCCWQMRELEWTILSQHARLYSACHMRMRMPRQCAGGHACLHTPSIYELREHGAVRLHARLSQVREFV